jgi:Tfp pilus assembly protein PilN
MIEINLVPDVKLELLKARRQRRTVISASIVLTVIAAAALVLLAFYAFGVQAIANGLADNGIKDESKKLQSVKDLSKTLTIQNQLSQLAALHGDKNISSRIFDILTATIPSGTNAVSITQLTLDADTKQISLQGQASNGYEALEVFKKSIAKTTFQYSEGGKVQQPINIATAISLGERSYSEDSDGNKVLTFAISFTYPDQLFKPTSQQGKIVGPERQRVTDSAEGVPASLFTDGGNQ